MRTFLVVATLFLGVLSTQAQEKVMNIQKTDGTSTQTRVADLEELSFLTVEEGGQGLLVKTVGGETAAVLFEANPVVTISSGKLTVKSTSADAVEFEISDIEEIVFGEASLPTGISSLKGLSCILQDGGALLRGIPEGTRANIYSIDGRCIPAPLVSNGELRLSRDTLGTGIYIVKVGSFTTKIKL